jgi:Tfp pilus assembly protein PilF
MVLNNYAYFLSLEGRNLERALTMVSHAIALSENNSTFLDTMAWVLYKLGRYAEAKKYMQQALSLDRSRSAELALHYGDILHALGEDFMAKTYWRKALERGAKKEEIEKRFITEESKPKK